MEEMQWLGALLEEDVFPGLRAKGLVCDAEYDDARESLTIRAKAAPEKLCAITYEKSFAKQKDGTVRIAEKYRFNDPRKPSDHPVNQVLATLGAGGSGGVAAIAEHLSEGLIPHSHNQVNRSTRQLEPEEAGLVFTEKGGKNFLSLATSAKTKRAGLLERIDWFEGLYTGLSQVDRDKWNFAGLSLGTSNDGSLYFLEVGQTAHRFHFTVSLPLTGEPKVESIEFETPRGSAKHPELQVEPGALSIPDALDECARWMQNEGKQAALDAAVQLIGHKVYGAARVLSASATHLHLQLSNGPVPSDSDVRLTLKDGKVTAIEGGGAPLVEKVFHQSVHAADVEQFLTAYGENIFREGMAVQAYLGGLKLEPEAATPGAVRARMDGKAQSFVVHPKNGVDFSHKFQSPSPLTQMQDVLSAYRTATRAEAPADSGSLKQYHATQPDDSMLMSAAMCLAAAPHFEAAARAPTRTKERDFGR